MATIIVRRRRRSPDGDGHHQTEKAGRFCQPDEFLEAAVTWGRGRCRMGRLKVLVAWVAAGSMASIAVFTQSRGSSGTVLYEGARLVIGDASAPVESGAFVVQNGRITAV